MNFTGSIGNDIRNGTNANDKFFYGQGGNDRLKGLGGNDTFLLGAKFNALDAIDGGIGVDTLTLAGNYAAGVVFGATTLLNVEKILLSAGFSYKLTTHDNTVAGGKTLTVDAHALATNKVLTFNGAHETNGHFVIIGGAGNDVLTGGAQSDTFDLTHGGNDTAKGGGGDDTFNLGATLSAADKIDGGVGTHDSVMLNGPYTATHELVFGATTMVNVETIDLSNGNSYRLTPADETVALNQSLIVDGSGLGPGDFLFFDGRLETNGHFQVLGGAADDVLKGGAGADTVNGGGGDDILFGGGGNDTIDGGDGNDTADYSDKTDSVVVTLNGSTPAGVTVGLVVEDQIQNVENVVGGSAADTLTGDAGANTFDLSHGGDDVASGGNGNDTFIMGAALTADDQIDGGDGNDTVILNGDYSGGVFDIATMVNVENLTLLDGGSYSLFPPFQIFAGIDVFTVDASALTATNHVDFDGRGKGDGSFVMTGGAGDDSFSFGLKAVFAASTVDGGDGNDTINLNGDYSGGVTLTAAMITNVENITVIDGHDYKLTTVDAGVAAGQSLTVGGNLSASHTLTFDGSAETDGTFTLNGSHGDDVLTGGALGDTFTLGGPASGDDTADGGGGDDTFNMSASFTSADKIDGGTGDDTVVIEAPSGDFSLVFSSTTMLNVEHLVINPTNSATTLTTDNATVASGKTLEIDGSLCSGKLTFDGSAETDGSFFIKSGSGSDHFTGGSQSDTFSYVGMFLSGATRDTITGFKFDTITHDLIKFAAVGAVDATVAAGTLNDASFDTDLAAAIGSGQLAQGDAVLFTPNAGDQAGKTFLIVDNGTSGNGYQSGSDLVIELAGATGTIGTADFIA